MAERFGYSFLGMALTPFYIMRRGLWTSVAAMAPQMKGKLLDLGCGSKPYAGLFAHAQDYVGLDVETSGHDHANSQVDVYYDGNTIPFDACSFDGVLAFETFEHIFNLEEVLAEIRRVLKPGGRLLITVPFLWPEHEEPFDFARYTSFGMADILQRSGYRIQKLHKSGSYLEAMAQLFIGYVYLQFSPKKNIAARTIFCAIFIFPLTVLGQLLAFILPRRYDCFCNLVILAQKADEDFVIEDRPPVDRRNKRPIDR